MITPLLVEDLHGHVDPVSLEGVLVALQHERYAVDEVVHDGAMFFCKRT